MAMQFSKKPHPKYMLCLEEDAVIHLVENKFCDVFPVVGVYTHNLYFFCFFCDQGHAF